MDLSKLQLVDGVLSRQVDFLIKCRKLEPPSELRNGLRYIPRFSTLAQQLET